MELFLVSQHWARVFSYSKEYSPWRHAPLSVTFWNPQVISMIHLCTAQFDSLVQLFDPMVSSPICSCDLPGCVHLWLSMIASVSPAFWCISVVPVWAIYSRTYDWIRVDPIEEYESYTNSLENLMVLASGSIDCLWTPTDVFFLVAFEEFCGEKKNRNNSCESTVLINATILWLCRRIIFTCTANEFNPEIRFNNVSFRCYFYESASCQTKQKSFQNSAQFKSSFTLFIFTCDKNSNAKRRE